jgi:hypothetical protein
VVVAAVVEVAALVEVAVMVAAVLWYMPKPLKRVPPFRLCNRTYAFLTSCTHCMFHPEYHLCCNHLNKLPQLNALVFSMFHFCHLFAIFSDVIFTNHPVAQFRITLGIESSFT